MTTLLVMASSISTSTPTPFSSFSSSINPKPTIYCSLSSSSVISYSKVTNSRPSRWVPVMGLSPFSPWSGLKSLGISVKPPNSIKLVQKGRSRRKGVFASLFGVGAPEALVIGVVALLVFGPKGLAEVARNLGKTLRAFQPTIRELQDVSREFKSTLEREIGLDDIANPSQNIYSSNRTNITPTPSPIANTEDSQTVVDPNGVTPPKEAYTSEDYLKTTEEQLKAIASQQQEVAPPTISTEQTQAYTSEEYLKITEEQLKAIASQQQEVAPPTISTEQTQAYTSEEYLKITEEQLKAIASQQQGVAPPTTSTEQTQFEEPQSQPQVKVEEAGTPLPPPPKPEIDA